MYVLGSPTLLFMNIEGVAAIIPQYIFLNTHMEGGSQRSVREKMAEKW
jgi:hypothetical protein